MYQKPDFIKVDVDIKDNYAAYSCNPNESYVSYHTEAAGMAPACNEKYIENFPYTDWMQPNTLLCYTTLNPAGY